MDEIHRYEGTINQFTGDGVMALSGAPVANEDHVHREVKEETGVDVKEIRYFVSQLWPFPHSLMIGFTATYVGGNIVIDRDEVKDEGWFTADNLPPIPPKISIARQLIDWFVALQRINQ